MSVIEDAIRSRMDDLRKRKYDGDITEDEYEKWDDRRWKACRDTPLEEFMPLFGFAAFVSCGSFWWLIASKGEDFSFWDGAFAALLMPILTAIAFAIVLGVIGLIVGRLVGDALAFGSMISVTAFCAVHWYTGVDYYTIPVIVWVALSTGIFGFAIQLRNGIARNQRMKYFLDSMPR